jgi:hypothetical protein
MRRFNQMMVVLSLSCGLLALPLLLRAANLLSNDGLEPPFVKYESYTDP